MIGTVPNIIISFVLCLAAIFAICIALSGYWQYPVSMLRRILMVVFAAVILWPTNIIINLVGAALLIVLLLPDIKASFAKNFGNKEIVKEGK